MAGVLSSIKNAIKSWAPPNSRRRRLLSKMRLGLFYLRHPRIALRRARYGDFPYRIENVYDLDAINRVIGYSFARPLRENGNDPGIDDASAIRWVIVQLCQNKAAHPEWTQPLRGGVDNPFCQWLCAKLFHAPAAERVRKLFQNPPGQRIRSLYHEIAPWRENWPLGLTPAGRAQLLQHLMNHALLQPHYTFEHALWWFVETGEDAACGLAETYLIQPAWQEKFPHALTAAGWPLFVAWVKAEYRVEESWLTDLQPPSYFTPDEEARVLQIAGVQDAKSLRAPDAPGLNVLGHFRYPSGLQEAALHTLEALQIAGVPHSQRDVPSTYLFDIPGRDGFLGMELYDTTVITFPPHPLGDTCYLQGGVWKRPGVHRAAIWYWELETLPTDWVAHSRMVDEIWAPTHFIQETMRKGLSLPVYHMPPGIRFPEVPSLTRGQLGLEKDRFTFLYMFDMNSVFQRKNPLAAVEAFRQAFGNSKEVQIAIKVSRGSSDPENLQKLQRAVEAVGGLLIDRVMTREESYGLLAQCDAYVSLHRSEGYGLTIAEAMAFGKPCIATAYSGNMDFMDETNSLLIPHGMVPIDKTYVVYPKGAMWADPDIGRAAAAMKWIADNPDLASEMGEQAAADVRELLSLKAYGERLRTRLEEIAAARKTVRRAA